MTSGRRRPALARALRAESNVIVDLSGLVFADTSLMLDLALLARRLRTRGWALMLQGAQPQISALIQKVGLHRLPGIQFDNSSPAFA